MHSYGKRACLESPLLAGGRLEGPRQPSRALRKLGRVSEIEAVSLSCNQEGLSACVWLRCRELAEQYDRFTFAVNDGSYGRSSCMKAPEERSADPASIEMLSSRGTAAAPGGVGPLRGHATAVWFRPVGSVLPQLHDGTVSDRSVRRRTDGRHLRRDGRHHRRPQPRPDDRRRHRGALRSRPRRGAHPVRRGPGRRLCRQGRAEVAETGG